MWSLINFILMRWFYYVLDNNYKISISWQMIELKILSDNRNAFVMSSGFRHDNWIKMYMYLLTEIIATLLLVACTHVLMWKATMTFPSLIIEHDGLGEIGTPHSRLHLNSLSISCPQEDWDAEVDGIRQVSSIKATRLNLDSLTF